MRWIILAVIFAALVAREEPRPNSSFLWLSVQKSRFVEVYSSIVKLVMIRIKFPTHVSVLGGVLTMFGITDLSSPYRSNSDDVQDERLRR